MSQICAGREDNKHDYRQTNSHVPHGQLYCGFIPNDTVDVT